MSKAITEDPYELLGNAIILQAVKDYRAALRRIKHNPKNRMAIDEALLIEKFSRPVIVLSERVEVDEETGEITKEEYFENIS